MDIEMIHRPGNTACKISLKPGETCTAESGAMLAMSGNMDITTTTHKKSSGNVLKAVKRVIAGESLFLNHFEPHDSQGEIWLGTALTGDMMAYELNQEKLIVQGGAFLACEDQVEIDFGWQGFKSLLSGESIFWLQLAGTGKVVFHSFGAIYPVEVDGEYIVDSGHIVAFNETLDFTITKAGKSWMHSFLSGEGLVCKFKGNGILWCQSHNPSSFGRTLGPRLKSR
ncbi:MAG: TIGR00266 family protein [Desulfobacterales bacterium]|nr:MAG: TIGR00266 family protein [Desulfobacterales bacterium]